MLDPFSAFLGVTAIGTISAVLRKLSSPDSIDETDKERMNDFFESTACFP